MKSRQTVLPLRLIFWGGILCVFDITFSETVSHNGRIVSGFRFDILNDFAGMLLITVGALKLSRFNIDISYRRSMQFVMACCILNCVTALLWHFVFQPLDFYSIGLNLLGLATLGSTVLFCTAMYRLSNEFSLNRSAKSWITTRILVLLLWVIPLGLVHIAGLAAFIFGQSFHLDLGVFGIPLLLPMVIPLVHLFVSTTRMQREAAVHPQNIAA